MLHTKSENFLKKTKKRAEIKKKISLKSKKPRQSSPPALPGKKKLTSIEPTKRSRRENNQSMKVLLPKDRSTSTDRIPPNKKSTESLNFLKLKSSPKTTKIKPKPIRSKRKSEALLSKRHSALKKQHKKIQNMTEKLNEVIKQKEKEIQLLEKQFTRKKPKHKKPASKTISRIKSQDILPISDNVIRSESVFVTDYEPGTCMSIESDNEIDFIVHFNEESNLVQQFREALRERTVEINELCSRPPIEDQFPYDITISSLESSVHLSEKDTSTESMREFSCISFAKDRPLTAVAEDSSEPSPYESEISEDSIIYFDEPLTAEVEFVLNMEIRSYLASVLFKFKKAEVNPSFSFIKDALLLLLTELDEDETLDILNTPLCVDPLQRLYLIQNTDIGSIFSIPVIERLLTETHAELLNRSLNEDKLKSVEIYIQMVFDCINEGLGSLRPYGQKGAPPIWSYRPLQLLGKDSLPLVFEELTQVLASWVDFKLGELSQDVFELTASQTNRLNFALCQELVETDPAWADFEDEELQTTIDTADIVLDTLIVEIINALHS